VSVFLSYFGPTIRATEGVGEDRRNELIEELRAVFAKYNRATDGTAAIENRFRLTLATCA
jgi:hypothetical protein